MSNSTCSKSNLNVKHVATLFEEVQSRYVNKLVAIDEKTVTGDERHKQKLTVYESYVKDLSIQTRLLLQSLDELEKEANQRVSLLENKLKKAHTSLQQHHSLSDVTKTVSSIESEKWKITHENLDLKHDLDCLTTFINTAKRTGKWDTKKLQLKTVPIDRITGVSTDETHSTVPLNREIQYRDERIQVLQAEIEQLRTTQSELAKQTSNKHSSFSSFLSEDDLKGQNNVLSKKVDDLRLKLSEECQKSETLKMDIRVKINEVKDLEEESKQSKQRYEEHISDLSTKLKTITDRHRESTASLNNDIKAKKQQIEQYVQQIEQITNEKVQLENDKSDLQRQCRVKDSITVDLETQMHNLQREVTTNNYPTLPIESTVPKIEYEKLDQEFHLTRKKLDHLTAEIKGKDSLINKLEQDIRVLKKFHDEQLEQQTQTSTNDSDQLRTEIRALKRLCEEQENELHKQSFDLRKYQDQLSLEANKNHSLDDENHQLQTNLQLCKDQMEKVHQNLRELTHQSEQYEYTIHDLNSQNNLIETKLFETITVLDLRNKTLINSEEQIEKMKYEFIQKQKDLLDRQTHIDQLEQIVIEKTAEAAELNETLETGLVQSHHREKFAEDNASKALHDVKVLQRELRHLSETLAEREKTNDLLSEQIQHLTNEYQIKQDEFHQMQKSLNKQLAIKQDQLVRLDQSLHEIEIKSKYVREECAIQEKEISRLNDVHDEQGNKIQSLQQDSLKLQDEKEAIQLQYERCEADLRNIKIYREEETRRYNHEIERSQQEISELKSNGNLLEKHLNEYKDKLSQMTLEREEIDEQNRSYQNEIENIQKMLYDETEAASKGATKIVLLTRQLDEEQKRSTEATHQLEDIKMQLKSSVMTNETLKNELHQARHLVQEYIVKETDFKQNITRTSSLYEEQGKSLDDRQREVETLNHLLTRLQIDYEKSKNDLSIAHDQIVQHEIANQTLKQHLNEKANDLSSITHRLQQSQQDLHNYEKEHRYSNEEYFEREQRLKLIENELSTMIHNYEKLQHDHSGLTEQFNKNRQEFDQCQKSDQMHREQLILSTDEAQICKRKLALLGNCFKTVVRKASETSERWANITARLHEQIIDLSEDANKLRTLDERFEQSMKMLNHLRTQHEDVILQYLAIKPVLEKAHLCIREYKRKWSQTSEENRHLKSEMKRLRGKIEDFHRAEGLMHSRIDEQELALTQLRKELSNEGHTRTEAQTLIERLKKTLDETVHERDHLIKNLANANKRLEKNDNDIEGYVNENRLLHQATQKLEKKLTTLHANNESLQRNESAYQEKINECESLLISLKDANKDSLCLLEQKKGELNLVHSQTQSMKYEQTILNAKSEKVDEMNHELKQHVAILERANDEHKRLTRKRERELDQMKTEHEVQLRNYSTLDNQCTKQEAELHVLRRENASLSEELKLMKENVLRCQEEQKRLRHDCDQALNLIHDGIPELCTTDEENGTLQEHLKKIPCVMQQLAGDRENLKTKNALLVQFVRGLSTDLNDCQSSQKKYKLLKAHSKQQQLLLNQLEAHVRFYESAFQEKGFFPAIEYSQGVSAPDVIDSNHRRKK